MYESIWVTWENQRRNDGISAALCFELHKIISPHKGWRRYLFSIKETILLFMKQKPKIVAVQNPSIILAVLTILFKPIFRFKIIVDAHNAGIYPLNGKSFLLNTVSKFVQKKADLTLITNRGLKRVVEKNNGIAFVLPDKIPNVVDIKKYDFKLGSEYCKIAYICTYSDDEPYGKIFECAKILSEKYVFYVTGRYQGKVNPIDLPINVKLLGYIPEDAYWGLLSGSDIIIDLTTRNDCLVCGAYEGIAVGKPLVLSENEATKELFNKGCVYVKANSESIRLGILDCVKEYKRKSMEIKKLKIEMEQKWEKDIETLKGKIYG